ncbi:MAG: tRNA preQ1(34) S-adenosylmethionine ribosyltransferase-isomerase QueA [Deltaproteobacteria bacterium]|nr:MAG: tRNA preQ1(34) S-adenosylmethionine ribosyltransferase-isomerase QueA [Deltaproteobacteria bacterium]
MRLADLEYALPPELVAQEPPADRTHARLLVLDRQTGVRGHAGVADLPDLLRSDDLLILNDTRVIPARVRGRRPTGGRLELLLVRPLGDDGEWEVLVRGTPRVGERVHLPDGHGDWVAALGDGRWRLRLAVGGPTLGWLERVGEVPLPPYIARPAGPTVADRERYQTVYASSPGAVAAPTAGLHFTPALLAALAERGIETRMITLHVGPGTFQPIRTDGLEAHVMAPERYVVPAGTADGVNRARVAGRRVVAVGTTTVRTLEAAGVDGGLHAGPGETDLFIRPGHRFRQVDALLTNFHLPRSPLLALVAAFAGWEGVRAAYEEAVRRRYRFYSFGDAMLIT